MLLTVRYWTQFLLRVAQQRALWHLVTPVKPAVLWPAGHFWQSARLPTENQFSGHGTQSSSEMRFVRPLVQRPAGQLMHDVCVFTFWYAFVGQSRPGATRKRGAAECDGLARTRQKMLLVA